MLNIPNVTEWTGAEAQYVYVTAAALNCRSSPEITPTNRLCSFAQGRQLIAFYRIGDWACVQPADNLPPLTGYCYIAHLTPCIDPPPPP